MKFSIAGFGPLVIRLAGTFSKVLIRFKNTLLGDSTAKKKRIMLSGETFFKGFAFELILLAFDVIFALALQVLTKPANRMIVVISTFLGLVKAIAQIINLLCRFLAFPSHGYPGYLTIPDPIHAYLIGHTCS